MDTNDIQDIIMNHSLSVTLKQTRYAHPNKSKFELFYSVRPYNGDIEEGTATDVL